MTRCVHILGGGAWATPPLKVTVDVADLRLGFEFRQWLHEAASLGLDGFAFAVGGRSYLSYWRLISRYMIPELNVDLPRILLMLHWGCWAWALRGLWGSYIYGLPAISA